MTQRRLEAFMLCASHARWVVKPKAAKALGLTVPSSVLLRADHVIE